MSYSDYLAGLHDGFRIGFNTGYRKGYEDGFCYGFHCGYNKVQDDMLMGNSFNSFDRLNECKKNIPDPILPHNEPFPLPKNDPCKIREPLNMPRNEPMPTLKDKIHW